MTISFTTGQAVAAMMLTIVTLAMVRCMLIDFENHWAIWIMGVAVISIASYFMRIIPWSTL